MTSNRKPRRIHRNKGGRKKGKKPVVGYYFDGKNSYTIYKDARGKETMKKDRHEHTKT